MSGPGVTLSSRNIRAAPSLRCAQDAAKTARGSPGTRACGAQLLSERPEREIRVGRCPGGDDLQREGPLAGHAAQLADGRWLAPQPRGPNAPLQYVAHLAVAERPESQHMRSGAREIGGEPAGRDQHKAARARREQPLHLAGVTRIVQDDEDASSGQQPPVQGRLFVRVKGEFPGRDADGLEEAAQRLAAGHRLAGVTEAAQVRPELPVREQVAELVSDVIRQRGLPGGRGSLDHDDRGVARRLGLAGEVCKDVELTGPAREVARADGKLPRLDGGPAGLSRVGRRQGGPRPQAGQPAGIDAASGEPRRQLPEGPQRRERLSVEPVFPGALAGCRSAQVASRQPGRADKTPQLGIKLALGGCQAYGQRRAPLILVPHQGSPPRPRTFVHVLSPVRRRVADRSCENEST